MLKTPLQILKFSIFFLLFLSLAKQVQSLQRENDFQRMQRTALIILEEGNSAYNNGNYKKAVEKYKKAWEIGKLSEACYNLAATLDIELNKNKEAQAYYKKYTSLNVDEKDIENARELMKQAKSDAAKETRWKDKIGKKSTQLILSLLKESKKIQKIKYDDSNIKEMLNEDGKLFTGSASVCLGCHATFMGPKINMNQTHPVGRIPKGALEKTVPNNVRFYKEGRVICLSCHNPKIIHFESGTKGKTYKVLRVDTGKKGENMPRFCAFCHTDKSSTKFLDSTETKSRQKKRRRRR